MKAIEEVFKKNGYIVRMCVPALTAGHICTVEANGIESDVIIKTEEEAHAYCETQKQQVTT